LESGFDKVLIEEEEVQGVGADICLELCTVFDGNLYVGKDPNTKTCRLKS
jgi:hypothetical protein